MKLKCLYASTERSSDAYYISNICIPDPYLSLLYGKDKIAVVSKLEYNRVKQKSKYNIVFEMESLMEEVSIHTKTPKKSLDIADLIFYFLKCYGASLIEVPKDFPSFLFKDLLDRKLPVQIAKDDFFSNRAIKTKKQIGFIKSANEASSHGFKVAELVLKRSKIIKGKLYLGRELLTSEKLRSIIESSLFGIGAIAENVIVACGDQACDPHEIGYGPISSNQLIVIDIFPKMRVSRYYGDMTRTFLKGKANSAQRSLVQTVFEAQKLAIKFLKSGVNAQIIHKNVNNFFETKGYHTKYDNKKDFPSGFIHSTGHGLGLDIHESPSISNKSIKLKKGNVVTIEPGLYYPNVGGCRIEDVFEITKLGSNQLSSYHYNWELK